MRGMTFRAADRPATGQAAAAMLVVLACCAPGLHPVRAAPDNAAHTRVPDPERAWEHRDMRPVSAWLGALAPERRARTDALRARAWLARRDGRAESALELIDRAIGRAPDDADLRVDRAAIRSDMLDDAGPFRSLGIARAVRRDLEHAVRVERGHVDALVALVTFHQRAPRIIGGDRQRGAELTDRLARVAPERLHVRKAMELADDARLDEAVEAMHRAIAMADQPRPKWFLRKGRWLLGLKRPRQAREAFEQALAEAPRFTAALYEIGRLGAESGRRVDRAIASLQRYLELPGWPGDPEPKQAWLQLGRVYRHAGRDADAEWAFRCALELDPDWREARRALDEPGRL